jgi:hypothetical protein
VTKAPTARRPRTLATAPSPKKSASMRGNQRPTPAVAATPQSQPTAPAAAGAARAHAAKSGASASQGSSGISRARQSA